MTELDYRELDKYIRVTGERAKIDAKYTTLISYTRTVQGIWLGNIQMAK